MINHLNVFAFSWFTGVVEERFDPLKAGRVRVRIHGYHTDDKTQIPTEDLFWAQTMLPVTSPATSNVSDTPRLIEGSMVIGFFADGNLAQQPIIIGTIPGIPQQGPDTNKGFNDPAGNYPRSENLDEPDISKLARGSAAEGNPVLSSIVSNRISNIPVAKAPSIQSVAEDITGNDYDRDTWNQPNPRFGGEEESQRDYSNGGSEYGFNKVYESESGHYFEIDDTPGSERINRTHRSGTYEEILNDGTKVVRVVGSDYEIVVGDKKCFVNGNVSITVNGDAKVLVKGNKYEEIEGNYHLHVRGDRRTKIEGNDAKETLSNESKQINGNQNTRVSLERHDVVLQNASYTVGNDYVLTVQGNYTTGILGNTTLISSGPLFALSQETVDIGASGNLNLASGSELNARSVGNMKLQIDGAMDFDVSGNMFLDVVGDLESTVVGDHRMTGDKIYLN